jgi:UDP-2,3-diacylglucosamine pyrophosphatase LpxH
MTVGIFVTGRRVRPRRPVTAAHFTPRSRDNHIDPVLSPEGPRLLGFRPTRLRDKGDAVLDAIILSDIHLGSDICQAKPLADFLDAVLHGHRPTARLILNGDVFDSFDFRRLKKSHWRVLSLIRKLSDKLDIEWLTGNHDGSAEIVSHLLGVHVREELVLESGGRKILVFHGHVFDDFIDNHPILTYLADCAYELLQKVDRSHTFAKLAKRKSKTFLRCARKIEEGALDLARRKECSAVCCGHTHVAKANTDGPVHYFNSGCWTELPCSFLTVKDGEVAVHAYEPDLAEAEMGLEPALA